MTSTDADPKGNLIPHFMRMSSWPGYAYSSNKISTNCEAAGRRSIKIS